MTNDMIPTGVKDWKQKEEKEETDGNKTKNWENEEIPSDRLTGGWLKTEDKNNETEKMKTDKM